MKDIYENSNPKGYHSVTPALVIRGASAALDFYQSVFDAKVRRCMKMPNGKVMHAEIILGDSSVMLGDEMPDWGVLSPASLGGSSSTLQIYVADADAVFEKAIAAGAEVVFPMTDQFWGDRSGKLKDPFGHLWMIATRIEEVSEEEMARRAEAWTKEGACAE